MPRSLMCVCVFAVSIPADKNVVFSSSVSFVANVGMYLPLVVLFLGAAGAEICPKQLSVDITSGTKTFNDSYLHQGIIYPPDLLYKDGDQIWGCICKIKTCVSVCCPSGKARLNRTCTDHPWKLHLDVYQDDTLVEKDVDYYAMDTNHKCNGIILDPEISPWDEFYMQEDGALFIEGDRIGLESYCLSTFRMGSNVTQAHICNTEMDEERPVLYVFGMMLSIPFLLVTLVIYYLMPDKNNIHTKCQMTYVASLMMAYLFLVVMQLNQTLSKTVCVTLASFCLYFFISSFCWMNITCIDIFLTFSGMRGFGLSKKSAQLKRFAFYCLYSYGVPLILVAVILGINFNNDHAAWYHPSLGYDKCWLRAGMPELLYFYGPMGALLACNIILFILTALKIRQINKDTAMLRKGENKKHYESDKQMFSLYFKLLIAMGINWSLEFISWLVDWQLGEKKIPQIFYVTDLCNALYGLLIFYLFVCKKAIWIMLKKRYYVFMGQPQKARALSTKASNYQTSDTEKTNVDESVTTSKV